MFWIDLRSQIPIYEQIKERVLEMIALGLLRPDDGLPSVRGLARELGINPNTVQKAYQELENENILCSVLGRGSFVKAEPDLAQKMRDRKKSALQKALIEGKRYGITRPEAEELIQSVYKEDSL